MRKFTSLILLFFIVFAAAISVNAQHKKVKTVHRTVRDSLRRAMIKRDSMLRSFKRSDNSLNSLLQKIENYNSLYIQDYSDFTEGFDTLEISTKLPSMEKRMALMGNLIENDHSSTLGYLFTIRDLMGHFKDNLDEWQDELADDNAKLDKIHNDVSEFKSDSAMHTVPADSTLKLKYLSQVLSIQHKWGKLDTCILKSYVKIGLLQNRVTTQDLLMLDINDRIDQKIHDFTVRAITNEYGYIWQRDKPGIAPADTVISKTYRLNSKLLKYFFDFKTTSRENLISHTGTVLVLVVFSLWIYASRRRLVRLNENYKETFEQTRYIVKHTFVSALLVAAILGLYFYDSPPFIFLEILMLVMTGCIGILIKSVWPKPLFQLWIAIAVLMFFYAIDNLFIQVCFADRLFLFILTIASIAVGWEFLKAYKRSPDGYPYGTRFVVLLFVIFNFVSLALNFSGRFSISKIVGVATIFDLTLGFGFFLLIQLLMESLYLQLEANKTNNNFISYIDFKILQDKFKSVLVKVAAILWLVKLIENLDIDDYIYGKLGDFLTHQYKFGTSELTFGSVVIFVFVIWLSIIASRVVSYFYDYAEQQSSTSTDIKKNKTSMLLIRLSVFAVGFIAAIIFSGIPITEVTIVVGALGVGIGFGLQNIVNNLVSGVILAFEKPVQVGDIIEVGNRSGKIKEIGIRASKIEAGDGSELIVPNGDLISQHVINWTLTNNNRRVELIVGVMYGSDIDKVEEILKRIVRNREDIMQQPAPLVFMHNFSDTSLEFRLLFWAADIGKWVSLKSDVMSQIYTEFAKEGIEIFHPK